MRGSGTQNGYFPVIEDKKGLGVALVRLGAFRTRETRQVERCQTVKQGNCMSKGDWRLRGCSGSNIALSDRTSRARCFPRGSLNDMA
jgi:hypothetical protein